MKEEEKKVQKVEETWRDVLSAYENLKQKHEVFCKAAVGVNLDFAGPGLREALQLLLHKRRWSHFVEDLVFQDFKQGGLSLLTPPVPQEKEDEQPMKPPANFKGKKKDSPTEE